MAINLPNPYIPSNQEVARCHLEWQKWVSYVSQDQALQLLIGQYPSNTNFDEILIKCTVLNFYYSTNIQQPYIVNVARHIASIQDFDSRVQNGDLTLPEKIANNPMVYSYYFSFATKYCSMHNPAAYPISDELVKQVLYELGKQHSVIAVKKKALDNYATYTNALIAFASQFNLTSVMTNGSTNFRLLDRYLWVLAKIYSKKSKRNPIRFGIYTIDNCSNGSIEVTKKTAQGQITVRNAKGALRTISNLASFVYNPNWNTRTFGTKLINYLNDIQP